MNCSKTAPRLTDACVDDLDMHRKLDFPRFRRHISTSSLKFLKRPRAQLVEVTVPADSIVKPLDVFKHI
jgi:hypothetical protein